MHLLLTRRNLIRFSLCLLLDERRLPLRLQLGQFPQHRLLPAPVLFARQLLMAEQDDMDVLMRCVIVDHVAPFLHPADLAACLQRLVVSLWRQPAVANGEEQLVGMVI